MEQPQQDLLELLAVCTAASINTVSGKENAPSDEVAALMIALNLDMADWWEVTAENYLSHVPKDRILTIVAEAVSPQHAQSKWIQERRSGAARGAGAVRVAMATG